jgi:hypothetical protein
VVEVFGGDGEVIKLPPVSNILSARRIRPTMADQVPLTSLAQFRQEPGAALASRHHSQDHNSDSPCTKRSV